MPLDKSCLDTRTFTAFAETSRNQYIYLCNMQTGVSRWSKGAVEYFGLPDEYMQDVKQIWGEHIHPEDREAYFNDIGEVFSGKKDAHDMSYRARNKEGDYVVCTCKGIVIKGEDGKPDLFAGTLINHGIMDNIDPNTGLNNIYEFLNSLKKILQQQVPAGIIEIGLNRFSEINDIYGYGFGNSVLKTYAGKLKKLVGANGLVYRMDGAKFAIVVENLDKAQALSLYSDMQDIAREEISFDDASVSLSISGGAMSIQSYETSEHSLLACASYALERSKAERHGELVFFENNVSGKGKRKIELMNALRQSVLKGCNGFYLCYQPLVRETDHKTVGMEALLRWHQDLYGEVPPGAFIPVLENDSCFYELGNWILEQALTDCKKIIEVYPNFVINVNISYSQLERSGFRNSVMEIIKRTQFPPQNLCLELTERCRNLNTEFLKGELAFFHSKGIKIALDDFGTGASSLNLLRELPIDSLKIDQSFIFNIQANEIDQTIVESVISCANKLGIGICIEGIENQQISDFVEKYEADTHQGYFYSRPVRIEKIMEMMTDDK